LKRPPLRTDVRLVLCLLVAASVFGVAYYALPLIVRQVELQRLDKHSKLERQLIEEAVKRMPPVPEESKKFGPRYPDK
jgi:hypothetical protein